MPWIDIILIAFVVLSAIIGLFRGFLQTLVSLCGSLLTLVLAIWLSKPTSGLLDSWFGLSGALSEALHSTVAGYCQGGELPWLIGKLAELLMGPDYSATTPVSSPEFINSFSDKIGDLIAIVISVVILYILIRLVLFLFSKLFNVITKNKALNSLDKIFGFVIGAAKGALVCFIVCGATYLLSTAVPFINDWLNPLLTESTIGAEFYKWVCSIFDDVILPFFFGK